MKHKKICVNDFCYNNIDNDYVVVIELLGDKALVHNLVNEYLVSLKDLWSVEQCL